MPPLQATALSAPRAEGSPIPRMSTADESRRTACRTPQRPAAAADSQPGVPFRLVDRVPELKHAAPGRPRDDPPPAVQCLGPPPLLVRPVGQRCVTVNVLEQRLHLLFLPPQVRQDRAAGPVLGFPGTGLVDRAVLSGVCPNNSGRHIVMLRFLCKILTSGPRGCKDRSCLSTANVSFQCCRGPGARPRPAVARPAPLDSGAWNAVGV